MLRIAEIVLVSALAVAVFAFGGTEPISFAVVQVLLFGVCLAILLKPPEGLQGMAILPMAVPLALVGLVWVQLLPAPVKLAERSSGRFSIDFDLTRTHLLLLLSYLAAFYLTIAISARRGRTRFLVFALLALGILEGFAGLLQYFTGWQPIRPFLAHELQPVGTYVNRNHFAGLLAMLLPFALALAGYYLAAIRETRAGRGACLRSLLASARTQQPVFWLFAAVILFVAVVFSQSRMGILAALAGAATFLMLATTRGREQLQFVLVPGFLLVAALLALWIGPEPVIARFEALELEYAASGQGRLAIWKDTAQLIRQSPWLGTGLGTFPQAYGRVQRAYLDKFVNHAHNDYLELATETGLVGAGLIFGTAFYLFLGAIRASRERGDLWQRALALGCAGSLVALLTHSLADFNLQLPANALVFSVVLGLTYTVTRSPLPTADRRSVSGRESVC